MDNNQLPLVSILCLSYNHEAYLYKCLEGFVMQKCTFPFEVIIHDDASTDKSQNIIREYTKNHPNIFHPIYQTENQFSQHIPIVTRYMIPIAKGKYLAFCEGDDYWTDPFKLQKQFSFLEAHLDYSICIHGCQLYDEGKGMYINDQSYIKIPQTLTISDLLYNPFMIASSTLFYRKNAVAEEKRTRMGESVNVNGDTITLFLYAEHGKIGFIPEIMSVYRIGTGLWSSGNELFRNIASLITSSKLSCLIEDKEARAKLIKLSQECQHSIQQINIRYKQTTHSHAYRLGKKILGALSWQKKRNNNLCKET